MVSHKDILEAVKYGENWYRDASRFNSYPRREPSFQASASYPDGMGGWAEVPEAESQAPMDLDYNIGPEYFADGGDAGTPGSPPGKEWRYNFEIEAPGSYGIFLVPLEAPQPMQDIAPWTVCDARIREDPTKKVTKVLAFTSTSYVEVTQTWINVMTCCVVNITREICALNHTEVRDSAVRTTSPTISSSRVAHVTREEFFAVRYCSDEPVTLFDGGEPVSLYVVMRECLESRIGIDGASAFFPYEEPYCYTNFRIPLDSDRLPGCSRGTYEKCYYENEPYTYLSKNDQDELNKIELAHRETCSAFHDEIGLAHFSTSETGVALNEATPGLVEITPEGGDYEATFPRVVL